MDSSTIPDGEKYLDIDETVAALAKLGMDLTRRQVQRAATERKLPFFENPLTGKMTINLHELKMHFRGLQNNAIKRCKQVN